MALIDKFRGIFQVRETPHRIAMSFSIGVFVGISPLFGIHTIGAFFLAWLLGLNRFIAVTGAYITNPWTIVPIYSFSIWIGAKIVGLKHILPRIDWGNLTFMYLAKELKPLVWPFVVGTVAVGIVGGIASYFIIYGAVIRYRKIRHGA
ncbi:MAG: DUF2062 domain-containing protein [Thermodesulfovibrionia bacterium]|nr:DUF2062 domain-containing protein [Thermodesulfovibrionia bacterium]MCK5426376.1 DUF2062 domain-containing protein [Thermodesulfovibrionia bacterium]